LVLVDDQEYLLDLRWFQLELNTKAFPRILDSASSFALLASMPNTNNEDCMRTIRREGTNEELDDASDVSKRM
jgi:hypothetical protein